MNSRKPIILSAVVAATSLMGKSVLAADPAIYSSISGTTGSLYTLNGQPNPSNNPNESGGEGGGDDFNTGYNVVNITGLTFYGGDTDPYQASAGASDPNHFMDGKPVTNYGVQISFYSLTGTRIASITPSTSELYGIGWHTLSASDFTQNGTNYLQTYGAGYIVFQPYYQNVQKYNGVSVETFNAPTGTPQFTLGFGTVPTLGANDPTISVQTATPGPGVISTGVYATTAGATAQYAQFELDGTNAAGDSNSPVWSATGSGNWDDSSKWTLGVPNSTASTANFFEGITADSTVTLVAGETVGTVNFDNPLHRYTLAGTSALTLSAATGTATLNGWGGSHTISCPLVYTGGLNVTTFPDPSTTLVSLTLPLAVSATGTLTKLGAGTLAFQPSAGGITTLNLPAINIAAGTVALQSSGVLSKRTLLVTTALTISGGRLDIGANDVELTGAGSTGLSSVFSAVQQGFNGGNWQGSGGITSSAAAASTNHLTAVGVVLNTGFTNTFDGSSTSSGDVLVKYTYFGDANLDGKVDASDYSRIDAAYVANKTTPGSVTGWFNGDFNYDGVTNGSDYTLIDNAFNTQGARLSSQITSPSAFSTGQIAITTGISTVPEPMSMGLTGCILSALLARRRYGSDVAVAQR